MNTNKEIIQFMYRAMEKGDLDAMALYLHDDVVVEEAESLPYGGLWKGKERYLDLVKTVGSTWEDVSFDVQALVADGDYVIALTDLSGKGVKTQKTFESSLSEVFFIHFQEKLRSKSRYCLYEDL